MNETVDVELPLVVTCPRSDIANVVTSVQAVLAPLFDNVHLLDGRIVVRSHQVTKSLHDAPRAG